MKKYILVLVVFLLTFNIHAQSPSMAKGKVVIYAGVGAGSGFFGAAKYKGIGYSFSSTPTIHLGFEYGFTEAIPKSIIGLGADFSFNYTRWSYTDSWGNGWSSNWFYYTILAKGYYHHTFLVGEKWDVYASPLAGLRFRSYNYTYNHPSYAHNYNSDSSVYPALGVCVGGRYYVSKAFGFYAEISQGYNVDYIKGGFAFKF